MMKRISGVSMIEVILAVSIILMLSPFIYNQVSNQTSESQNVHIAKSIDLLSKISSNYIKVNEKAWDDNYSEKSDGYELLNKMQEYGLKLPIALYPEYFRNIYLIIDKKTDAEKSFVDAYLIYQLTDSVDNLRAIRIVRAIGESAGFLQNGKIEGFYGTWGEESFSSPVSRGIIIRLSYLNPYRDKKKFLYANPVSGNVIDELMGRSYNTMENDLIMGRAYERHNIDGVRYLGSSEEKAELLEFENYFVSNMLLDDVEDDVYQLSAKNVKIRNGLEISDLIVGDFEVIDSESVVSEWGDIYGDIDSIKVNNINVKTVNMNGKVILNKGTDVSKNSYFKWLVLRSTTFPYINCNAYISKNLVYNDNSKIMMKKLVIEATESRQDCILQRNPDGSLVIEKDADGNEYTPCVPVSDMEGGTNIDIKSEKRAFFDNLPEKDETSVLYGDEKYDLIRYGQKKVLNVRSKKIILQSTGQNVMDTLEVLAK